MTKWEAIAKIVKSFNDRGSPFLALLSLILMLGIPSIVIAFGIWHSAPQLGPSLEVISEKFIKGS
jgi:hypothetical protein